MKTAYDFKHVKGTTAIALIKDGVPAGKIVANWSDNPAGSVCTATIHVNRIDGLNYHYTGTGRAAGYGYDKLSGAIYQALREAYYETWDKDKKDLVRSYVNLSLTFKVEPGAGNQRSVFESLGYQYVEVC